MEKDRPLEAGDVHIAGGEKQGGRGGDLRGRQGTAADVAIVTGPQRRIDVHSWSRQVDRIRSEVRRAPEIIILIASSNANHVRSAVVRARIARNHVIVLGGIPRSCYEKNVVCSEEIT